MTIFSDSVILPKDEVEFLINLLPNFHSQAPDIFIIDRPDTILSMPNTENNLFTKYNILKEIVHSSIFSTYNYKHCMIFIYLFNLPYRDPFLIKLHGVFCLFHEMRHHQQFIFDQNRLIDHLSEKTGRSHAAYSFSWVEKDANRHAVKWMRKNRKEINEKFKFQTFQWDVRVNENNRLRIMEN